MAIIPQYNITNYGVRPVDFSPIVSAIQGVKARKRLENERQRLLAQNVKNKLEKFDPASFHEQRHREIASQEIEDIQDLMANYFTFENYATDKESKKLKKNYGDGPPTLNDREYSQVMDIIGEKFKKYSKWKADEDLVDKENKTFMDKPGSYHPRRFEVYMDHYKKYDERLGDALLPAPANPIEVLHSLDTRTDEEKKPVPKFAGDYINYTVPGLDPETQKANYYSEANTNIGFQYSMVDAMLGDNTRSTAQKKQYIKGILVNEDVANVDMGSVKVKQMKGEPLTQNEQFALAADQKVNEMINNYDALVEYDPHLIEAAKYYCDTELDWPSEIGKGGEYKTPNQGAYNQRIRKKEEEKTETPQPRTYVAGDYKLDQFVDLGTLSPSNYEIVTKIPKGTLRFTRTGGGGVGYGPDDEEGNRKQVTIPQGKELSKKFPELDKRQKYVIAGYDKKNDYIVLYNIPDKYGEQYEYLVPLKSNEWMIKESEKEIGDKPIKKDELTENYFD